jgi:tRNA 5-methylaminomethyl-2-thiouridine biosynthesis bifunctional protein
MVWCGATSQAGDDDPAVRRSDHLENLGRLTALLGSMPWVEAMRLHGRTAFRWATQDRLPVIGAVPALQAGDLGRPDQPRLVPREAGLFVFTALGSRGIAASALGARILAAAITGAPSPVETDLLDAVDPARFQVRVFRRAMASDAGAASGISPRSGPSPGRPAAD